MEKFELQKNMSQLFYSLKRKCFACEIFQISKKSFCDVITPENRKRATELDGWVSEHKT